MTLSLLRFGDIFSRIVVLHEIKLVVQCCIVALTNNF
jgi:hypothetical protein